MSLAELLQDGRPVAHKYDKVAAAYKSLGAVEQDAFRVLIHDDLWSAPQIAAELTRMGYDITGDQIRNFRTKLKTGRVTL
jgi:hypothetical protein